MTEVGIRAGKSSFVRFQAGAHTGFFSRGVIGDGRSQWLGGTMASAEHKPITGVQGQSPLSGGQGGEAP